jgi:hypothetical protein
VRLSQLTFACDWRKEEWRTKDKDMDPSLITANAQRAFFLTWDEASYFPLWMCAGMAGRFERRAVRLGRPLTNMVGSSVVD